MVEFRRRAKALVERISGRDIERIGSKCFALIDKKTRIDAWFSYRAQVQWLIDTANIDLVLDVGANEGQFAQLIRAFYSGRILSFEPVSVPFDRLSEAASNDDSWTAHKLALGSQESTQTIHVSGNTVFSSLLPTNEYGIQRFGQSARSQTSENVSIQRLDALLDALVPNLEQKRIFLKMDTQGYDIEVFKGLGNKLKHVVALQSEVSLISIYHGMPHWTDSISAYEQAGFGVVGMFPVTRDRGRVVEYDCLLVRTQL